ncbi:hypothetical protein E3E36_10640 [Thermococcus sp. M36]|uniref:hypothetical protein n=1 Tax=Thermococcus sp. M36 TaxID=1638261 RepID=UPI001438912B|nr:hypothetical protein [Thermococcus sp. M36]NJE06583.1 hypothetical protein [Thermococcus sp. M36]
MISMGENVGVRYDDIEDVIRDIVPWVNANPLAEILKEVNEEKRKVLEMVRGLFECECLPEDVEMVVKSPSIEDLMGE